MDITEYIGIPQLTEINYTYWSVIMEATLASQGLWSIVSGDRPRATERFETKDDKQAKSSHERWDRDNAKAKVIMMSSMPNRQWEDIWALKTARL